MKYYIFLVSYIFIYSLFAQDCATLQTDIGTGFISGTYTISTTCATTHNDDVLSTANITVTETGDLSIDITGGSGLFQQLGGSITVEGDGSPTDGVLSIDLDLALEGSLTVQTGGSLSVAGNLTAGTTVPTTIIVDGVVNVGTTNTPGNDLLLHDNVTISGSGSLVVANDFVEVDGDDTVDDSGWTGSESCPGGCSSVLPVELSKFEGRFEDGRVRLLWETVLEINNSGFEIQRSYDGVNFDVIDFVAGFGNSSSVNSYSYSDRQANFAFNAFYYRLNQIDFDGQSTFSSIIRIEGEALNDFRLFPTNVYDEVTISGGTVYHEYDVSMIDLKGTEYFNGRNQTIQSINKNLNESIQSISEGLYFVRISFDNEARVLKFLKQ